MKSEYWVSCEKYVYYRMCVGECESIEEARDKAREMIENGDDEKWIADNGDGGTEIKGFCDNKGDEVQYPGEDYRFWDY